MGFHGGFGQAEPFGDLGVGQAGGDLGEDLAFPRGQLFHLGRQRRPGAAARVGQVRQERGEQPPGDGGRDDGVAAGDRADRGQQVVRRDVLEQEAARAGPQPGVGVLVEVERGQDEHPGGAGGGGDAAGGLDAVRSRHPHVHQHHVRVRGLHQAQRGGAVAGLADHLHVVLGVQDLWGTKSLPGL